MHEGEVERKPECKPSSGAGAQKAFAGHRRTEVECMHAAKEHTEGKRYSHIWWRVTLFWDFPARLIGSAEKPRGSRSPAPCCRPFVGLLWKSETRKEAETGSVRYNRPAQQQCVGRYSNIDTRLDTSRIDSRINRVPIP